MPYTPPASSVTLTTPAGLSPRRHGRHNSEPLLMPAHRPRTALRSSSYLHRHRRSPSIRSSVPTFPPQNVPARDQESSLVNGKEAAWKTSQASSTALIPSCSILSPPESRQNSSDEDEQRKEKEKQLVLAELQAAIRSMETPAVRSPSKDAADTRRSPSLELIPLRCQSVDGSAICQLPEIGMQTPDQSDREDEAGALRPAMIRKKSGELVRPALRMKKRPSSMPGTPTFVKNVHFDVQLEHVRHFLQVDRPVAVSAGSSPVDEYDGDNEFPFESNSSPKSRSFKWEANVTNFPRSKQMNSLAPVKLEKIFLSADNKYLVGVVSVANLAFQKHVVARFTLDHWKTVSEIEAEYNNDPHLGQHRIRNGNYDQFHFNIRLADLADLESKTMFICIRYHVNGLELWDNNHSRNYHINFCKKYKCGTASKRDHPTGSIGSAPRTNRNVPRPLSMPPISGSPSFVPARSFRSPKDKGFARLSEQVPLHHADDDLVDAPTKRTKPGNQAFTTRYDFGSSLSAAMQPGNVDMASQEPGPSITFVSHTAGDKVTKNSSAISLAQPRQLVKPCDLISTKPYHQSPGYKELVDKYCFYETGSPTKTKAKSTAPTKHESNTEKEQSQSDDTLLTSPLESCPFDGAPLTSSPIQTSRSPSPPSQPSPDLRPDRSSPPTFSNPFHTTIPARFLSESPTRTAIPG
ncbi:hypothetical protein LOZ36_002471 [Ophidiomyces ophidiicola]|nr:hypothetical protein LOZ36_002471 [Ophidiomyces ophidiicola]